MNKFTKYAMAVVLAASGIILPSCSEFEPTGMPDVPPMATAQDLSAEVINRSVRLQWALPATDEIEGVNVIVNGDANAAIQLGPVTEYLIRGQKAGSENFYTIKLRYKGGYISEGVSVTAQIPMIETKIAYILTAADAASLPDDDERAAAAWFANRPDAMFVQASDIASIDPDIVTVVWIMVDRVGLGYGLDKLPGDLGSDATIAALREYSQLGGSLYLSNMAVQLTAPLEMVPEGWQPTIFGDGSGGFGTDVWCINPKLGWDFRDGNNSQGYYDRTANQIFDGLTMEDPNGYGYDCLPLIGPGQREDHNCMWDCNIYGKGDQADVIKNFEVTTNSLVLATWGHVRDHCVAGLVDFFATPAHGHCVANGFAAYEWKQNSNANVYQANVEKLTENILDYLK